ncbi:MAG: glutamate synthase large subunit [Actinomycetota bacterium]
MRSDLPPAQGLYDPANEHDACGVAFVADVQGRRSHRLVRQGLDSLCNLEHRGAKGAEVNTGDGAGILIQVPHEFFVEVVDFELPEAGHYAAGCAYLPQDDAAAVEAARRVEAIFESEGLRVLGWRDVPTDDSMIGTMARDAMPTFRQLFVGSPVGRRLSGIDLERRVFMGRKRSRTELDVYFASLSPRTIVYKGMLDSAQVEEFYPDLSDERVTSALALVHSRFSTNTFPSWPLAHPYRYIAHNGEINTLKGNRNWMRAREALMRSDVLPGDLDRIFPILTADGSDTASFDECLELLHLAGRSLPHAVLMMIPEAWENHETMDPGRRAFYEYHASLMEAWDGPALVAFTDGAVIGAVLDRNGLRPGRYWVTDDGLVVLGSETGLLGIDPASVVRKGRLEPGKMFLVDTEQGRIVDDDEIKAELAAAEPYGEWIREHKVALEQLPQRPHHIVKHDDVRRRQRTFGYTHEELRILLAPMARNGAEPIGSMGSDVPLAVLSQRSRQLFEYFKQLFAQVTNPPLDAIREELVTAIGSTIGPEGNVLDPGPHACRQIELPYPVITPDELNTIVRVNEDGDLPHFEAAVVTGLYEVAGGGAALEAALDRVCAEASEAIARGAKILVLSDRGATDELAPIPSLLLTGAVHHHLIREKTRTKVGLIVESGDAREVHHIAVLLGYGAGAVCPWVAFESIEDMIGAGEITDVEVPRAYRNLVKALSKGVVKVMSKIGVSTVASYTGAQIFEAIGLRSDVIDRYFTGTTTQLEGMGLDEIAEEVAKRHASAYLDNDAEVAHRELEMGGDYQWRREGEFHLFNPETVYKLQHSTREGRYDVFKEYTSSVDRHARDTSTLRGLLELKPAVAGPIPIDEVEPVSEIVKRFSTGAMSYGSISAEAHETLAIAMNRLGAKSNTGEGGEDAERFTPDENGDLRRSSIKQVASGRFGVTSEYLVNSDDLQIKMAQGAKPGEGGQLPGKKVWPWIAKTRHSTPGVGLISPPPHHDIYSIEDLAQLIHDLKNANPEARVHVKLVSEVGVGTVAAGVSKAHADVVLISGHDGGTGASPLNSIKHAGTPWELGLAETQQTLLLNGLRDRIVVQADGQMKTGRDVVIAALLGAEEFGFATAPLVVSGCVMMRVCHLDTCPVGIATQNPELRKRFNGKPEFVVNFMEFIAEEVREHLAELGCRTLEEAIGRVDLLDSAQAVDHWKAHGLDVSPLLHQPEIPFNQTLFCSKEQDHGLDRALDNELIARAKPALQDGTPVRIEMPTRNVNRTVGTMLGHHLTKRWGGEGLPHDTIHVEMTGSGGQSFGAFVPRGITLRVTGDANDYLGKGLSGGRIVVRPPEEAPLVAEDNIIAGNVILYGATGGEVFLRGKVGERFCVRNSGALAVVEGIGDHGCEYMTGGRAVILGPTGRNFAAGMSGGIAFVLDESGMFPSLVNPEMVDLIGLSGDDEKFLAETIQRHVDETGSAVATRLLADWDASLPLFVKVMPRDYQRVLDAMARAEAEGDDVDAAVMAASQG